MFSNQLRVMGFVFFPTCLPRPGWSLDLLTLIKRISLHHERQRSPRDLKTSERRRRTDGPSRPEGARHQPNKSLFFFFLPLARRHPAKLWSRCNAGGRLVQTGSYTQKILLCFFQIRKFFSLPEMFWSLCTAEGQRALSASPPPPAAKVYSSQM